MQGNIIGLKFLPSITQEVGILLFQLKHQQKILLTKLIFGIMQLTKYKKFKFYLRLFTNNGNSRYSITISLFNYSSSILIWLPEKHILEKLALKVGNNGQDGNSKTLSTGLQSIKELT